jgi:hypothetical protein
LIALGYPDMQSLLLAGLQLLLILIIVQNKNIYWMFTEEVGQAMEYSV